MTPTYVVRDEFRNTGQQLRVTQGEGRFVVLYFLDVDGGPLYIDSESPSQVTVKIYTGVSSPAITKTLTGSTVAVLSLNGGEDSGPIGITFSLTPTDTLSMVANSSGIPVEITVVSASSTYIYNIPELFLVDVPVVT